MSQVLSKATEHFRGKLTAELLCITVPEWADAKIYYKPVSTLKEQSKLVELASQNKTVEALVESLVMRARNADGSRMFNIADRVVLMNEVDPAVVIRIVGEMNRNIEDGDDTIEKN